MNMNIQSKLREIQDEASNRNWRINFISHAKENKPIVNGIDTQQEQSHLLAYFFFSVALDTLWLKEDQCQISQLRYHYAWSDF
jgi:hypothetical protein